MSLIPIRCSTKITCAAPYGIIAGIATLELDQLVDQQSMQADSAKRKQIVWQIERILAEAGVRPVRYCPAGASCWEPWVKGLTPMTNSIYNG